MASRWCALDDLALTTDPLTANRYQFTGANPVNYVEVDGHMFKAESGGGLLPCQVDKRYCNDAISEDPYPEIVIGVATGGAGLARLGAKAAVKGGAILGARLFGRKAEEEAASYAVYVGTRRGETLYAGITTSFVRRVGEHALDIEKAGLEFRPVITGLTRMQAREAEQAIIFLHGRQINRTGRPLGGQLLNRINSISEKNPRLAEHIENGLAALQKAGYR